MQDYDEEINRVFKAILKFNGGVRDDVDLYTDAVERANKFSQDYHNGNSAMRDGAWDMLFKYIKMYETKYPDRKLPNSPTTRVGEPITNGSNVNKHTFPMLSLGNVFSVESLQEWVKAVATKLGIDVKDLDLVFEPKYDGCALTLQYINGTLVEVRTRGDGEEGEVIDLAKAKKINGVQTRLSRAFTGEIRGEVILYKDTFEKILEFKSYSNSRNAVAGLLRIKDVNKFMSNVLTFIQYSVHYDKDIEENKQLPETHTGTLEWLAKFNNFMNSSDLKIPVDHTNRVLSIETYKDIPRIINFFTNAREHYKMVIDGVVIKVNSLEYQEKLGFTSREPNFAIAYKFKAADAISTLESVFWTVGRTGVLTPVARIKPTLVGDVIVEKVTLHNPEEIKRLDLKIGDDVTVIRSGDVIPKIVYASRGETVTEVITPTHCPSCASELVVRNVELYCMNLACAGKQIANLHYFVSRDGMDIKGMGESMVEAMYKSPYQIDSIAKFVNYMTCIEADTMVSHFPTVPGANIVKVKNYFDEITKIIPIVDFVTALGIPLIGKFTAKQIFRKYATMEELREVATKGKEHFIQELSKIGGISDVTAKAVYLLVSEKAYTEPYDILVKAGASFRPEKGKPTIVESCWGGSTFTVTGSFGKGKDKDGKWSREEVISQLESMGITVTSNVDKAGMLIVGDNGKANKTKFQKAKEKEIPIYKFADFYWYNTTEDADLDAINEYNGEDL